MILKTRITSIFISGGKAPCSIESLNSLVHSSVTECPFGGVTDIILVGPSENYFP